MGVGERIKSARKARGVTRPVLASLTGIPYPTLAGIENGDQASSTRLHVIANAMKLNLPWLTDGVGPRDAPDQDETEWANVLAARVPASLGDSAPVPDDYAETHKLKFRASSLRRKGLRPERLAVCYGRGDSMLPRIKTGDAILFDTGERSPKDGHLYVVTYDHGLYAKKLINLGGRWFMESLNRDHPWGKKPEPIDEFKGFEIHGRVRWVGSWED